MFIHISSRSMAKQSLMEKRKINRNQKQRNMKIVKCDLPAIGLEKEILPALW